MPSNWLSIDSNFPTFTGEESPEQQIRALHNYLFQLREGLQYSLQNLSADNFNAAALQNLTDAQKNEVTAQLEKVYALLNQMTVRIDSLSGRISGTEDLTGRVDAAEGDILAMADRIKLAEENIEGLADWLTEAEDGIGGLQDQMTTAQQALEKISGAVQVAEDGSITIGSEGIPLHLVGQVYINGVLIEQEGGTA